MEDESEFHGTMSCQHAKFLPMVMRDYWPLLDEKLLIQSGPEWLHLVNLSDPDSTARLILIMWRAWFVRDRWTHENKWLGESSSVNFLLSYWASLSDIQQQETTDRKVKGASLPLPVAGIPACPKRKKP